MTETAKRLREIASQLTSQYDGEFDNWAIWIARAADELNEEKAKHRETLAVLQTAHECEQAAQDTIRRLQNDLQAHRDALAQADSKQ